MCWRLRLRRSQNEIKGWGSLSPASMDLPHGSQDQHRAPKAGKGLGEEDDPPMNHKSLTSLHIVRPYVVPEHEEKTEGPFSKNPFALSSLEFT